MYILPKRYPSIRSVKIADVIRSFPLQYLGAEEKRANPLIGVPGRENTQEANEAKKNQYSNLHFRFETCIYNPGTQKKILVYKDIACNNYSLKELESIPVPYYKDQIRVKVLKMPTGNQHLPPIRK